MRPRTPPSKFTASGNGVAGDDNNREKEKQSVLGLRKKGIGVRAWLMIDPTGRAQLVEAGKHAIMRRACLPARDLRILDPLLSYPSTILGRERAIVVNLEHIKAVITAQEVLLLNSKDPVVEPIVAELQRRLPLHFNSLGQQVPGDGGGGLSDNEGEGNHKGTTKSMPDDLSRGSSRKSLLNLGPGLVDAGVSPSRANGGPSVLPFEFRALEVCLESACNYLDTEATTLEREAYPALDELTLKLSTLNLERVRQIKSRLVEISGRVQKVRDEIEQLLDDDEDMAEMYLTDKLMRMQIEGSLSPTLSHEELNLMSPNFMESSKTDFHKGINQLNMQTAQHFDTPDSETVQERVFKSTPRQSQGMEDLVIPEESSLGVKRIGNQSSGSSSTSSSTSRRGKLDVEELEMLLEAYFAQIDSTLNKLSALREYVDDTEDYINIMLDDKQNHLLQMGVLLTTATLVASAFIVVTGIFGMNIHIDLFNQDTYRTTVFVWVVCGSLIGCAVIYVAAFACYKRKGLIE